MRKTLLFAAVLILCLLLCACSVSSEQSDPGDREAGTQSETAEQIITEAPITTDTQEETGKDGDGDPITTGDTVSISLPESNYEMSVQTAKDLLNICSQGLESSIGTRMQSAGFEVLFSRNFDKSADDPSHTSAYSVGKGRLGGRNAYIVVVRGTSGGEWYSNFDFCPSHTRDSLYSENFMEAASDIYQSVKELFEADRDAYIFVCGHSRGAATANLLGVLLDDNGFDNGRLYVYTYATPNTVKQGAEGGYNNIFNFINRKDVVTYLPPEYLGFVRAGTDIILNEGLTPDVLFLSPELMQTVAPSIESYYNDRYSLTEAGLSEDGATVFELMSRLGGMLGGVDSSFLLFASSVREGSDLYPIVSSLTGFSDPSSMTAVLYEHLPATYLQLINKLK